MDGDSIPLSFFLLQSNSECRVASLNRHTYFCQTLLSRPEGDIPLSTRSSSNSYFCPAQCRTISSLETSHIICLQMFGFWILCPSLHTESRNLSLSCLLFLVPCSCPLRTSLVKGTLSPAHCIAHALSHSVLHKNMIRKLFAGRFTTWKNFVSFIRGISPCTLDIVSGPCEICLRIMDVGI